MKLGITERGDAGLDYSWVNKMPEMTGAIIISKNLRDKLIEKLVEFQDKVILHMTCTGHGGSILEPYAPNLMWTYQQYLKLMETGFPASHVVLRLDPIIPNDKGRLIAEKVLELFSQTGITRVRYSFLDMYPHVVERFKEAGIPHPYGKGMMPPEEMINKALSDLIHPYREHFQFESCAENTPDQIGCISPKDMALLGITEPLSGSAGQRKGCLCPREKTELLNHAKRCGHKCLYCYWMD